jgi:hypothetical protein
MNPKIPGSGFCRKLIQRFVAVTIASVLVFGNGVLLAGPVPQEQAAGSAQETVKIPPEQLDSLVAPIALYPDPLLSQTLVASTYPLELVQLQQWLTKNPDLKDKKLVEKVSKQDWDPSIQAMAALPDVVKRLTDDIQWTTDLGNAFLAQQTDVMDAIQRMRLKAQGKGTLGSNEQQKVETRTEEGKQVIVIEQASPEVVYAPAYDPYWAYGDPFYPYPPIYYPGAGAIAFGAGIILGAAWGGGWGWGCGWGNGDLEINHHNNFNRNTNISGGDRTNIGNRGDRGKWQHNPKHRGGAPYGDRSTANRFGGTARGDSLTNRQAGARQTVDRQGGNMPSTREGGRDRSGDRGGGKGPDSIGGRDLSKKSGGKDKSGFGGGNKDFSGSKARSSSSRGSSSWGGSSRGGGGFSRGGGRGGGGRR